MSWAQTAAASDCATLNGYPDTRQGATCVVSSEKLTAIVYSKQQAGLVASRWKRDLLQKMLASGERWSNVALDAERRKTAAKELAAKVKTHSTLVLDRVERQGTTYMVLHGDLSLTLTDGKAMQAIVERESIPQPAPRQIAKPEPKPMPAPKQVPAPKPMPAPAPAPVPVPAPVAKPEPQVPQPTVWHLALQVRNDAGELVTKPLSLDFSKSASVFEADAPTTQKVAGQLEENVSVKPGTTEVRATLYLDGYNPMPGPGGFVKHQRTVEVVWHKPADGGAQRTEQVVNLVGPKPVLAYMVNYAGLTEDEMYAAADLGSMLSTALAKQHFTHFMGMNGYGRRVEKRYEIAYPQSAAQVDDETSKLIDTVVEEAGPLPPQIGTGFEFCRAADEGDCWVVYVAKRSYANLPTNKVIQQLRNLPTGNERLVVIELVGNADAKPLFSPLTDRHMALQIPEAWLDDGKKALEPVLRQVLNTLNGPAH